MAEPYLISIAKVIKLDKHAAMVNHMIVVVPFVVLFSACCIVGGTFDICTIWIYYIDGKFLKNYLCLLQEVLLLSLSRKVQNIPPLPHLGTYPYLLEGLQYALEDVTQTKFEVSS